MERSKELQQLIKTLFEKSRTLQFIRKSLYTIEMKAQHHLRLLDKSNCDKPVMEYRCQRSKCTFKIAFVKKQKYYQLNTLNLKHNHPHTNPTFELEHLKKAIEKKSDYIFQEYFVSRINNESKSLQLTRPCLILEDMKNQNIFNLSQLTSNKKYKVQLKKKFDNIIQNLRREFKQQYPNITCIDDLFQVERQCKSLQMRVKSNSQIDDDSYQSSSQTKCEDQESYSQENIQQNSMQEEEEHFQSYSEQTYTQCTSLTLDLMENNQSPVNQSQSNFSWDQSKINQDSEEQEEIEQSLSQIAQQYNKMNKIPSNLKNQQIVNSTNTINISIAQQIQPEKLLTSSNLIIDKIENNSQIVEFEYETIVFDNKQIIQKSQEKKSSINQQIQQQQQQQQKQNSKTPFGYFDWILQNNKFY